MDRRVLPLVLGVAGLGMGVVALAADASGWGLAAGLLALVAAIAVRATVGAAPPGVWRPDRGEHHAGAPGAPVAAGHGGTGSVADDAADDQAATLDEPADVPADLVVIANGETLASSAFAATAGPNTDRHPLLDPTGLFNEQYFRVAVETRVSAARRHLRPVAVVLFDVVEGTADDGPRRAAPDAIVEAIRATLREADTACRLDDGRYAFVLEDTPEDGAIWTVERLRRALNDMGESDAVRWAGIACYPAHAFSADEALAKAESALNTAREWHQDRIEVATAE